MAINVDISKITGINQVGNSYQRKSAVPLDYYSLFNTKAEAEAYAASNPVSYVGQVISYIDNGEVKVCVIANAAGLLKEVGTAPVGDGKTIEVSAEGAVALLGAASAANGTLPMLEEVEGKSKLVWKTLEDIGAGDGNDNTTYAFAFTDQKITITPSLNGVAQNAIEVDLSVFATEDEVATAIQEAIDALPEDKDTTYSVKENDKVLKLTGTEFSTELNLVYNNNRISLTGINGEEIAGFDASVFVEDGVLNNVSYDAENDKLIFVWNIIESTDDDGTIHYKTIEVPVGDLVDVYTAGNGLNLNSNKFSIKIAEDSEAFLSAGATGLKLSGIQTAIDDAKQDAIDAAAEAAKKYESKAEAANVYTKAETDGLLSAKANSADVATTYATKEALKATDDVAKDAQSRVDIVEGKIDEITSVGGEPNVVEKIKVNGVTLEVEKDAEGKSTKSVNIPVPTKFTDLSDDSGFDTRITNAQTKANEAAQTASEAVQAAGENANKIQTNITDISNLKTLTGEHTTKISALEQADATHTGEFNALSGTVTQHGTDIANLKTGKADTTVTDALSGRITTNENAIKTLNETTIPAINGEIAKKANAESVYTKTEVDGLIDGAVDEASYDDTEVRNLITGNANAITAIYKAAEGETPASGVLATEIARVEGLVSAEKSRAEGVETGLNTRLETVEAFWKEAIRDGDEKNVIDTLKEIQEYIESDESGASAMAASIKANADAIAAIYTPASGEGDEAVAASGVLVTEVARLDKAIADNSTADKKYTDDAIAALQASIHGVDDDTIKLKENKAYVAKVSTDILVQGETELIFSAGNASGYNTQA